MFPNVKLKQNFIIHLHREIWLNTRYAEKIIFPGFSFQIHHQQGEHHRRLCPPSVCAVIKPVSQLRARPLSPPTNMADGKQLLQVWRAETLPRNGLHVGSLDNPPTPCCCWKSGFSFTQTTVCVVRFHFTKKNKPSLPPVATFFCCLLRLLSQTLSLFFKRVILIMKSGSSLQKRRKHLTCSGDSLFGNLKSTPCRKLASFLVPALFGCRKIRETRQMRYYRCWNRYRAAADDPIITQTCASIKPELGLII